MGSINKIVADIWFFEGGWVGLPTYLDKERAQVVAFIVQASHLRISFPFSGKGVQGLA